MKQLKYLDIFTKCWVKEVHHQQLKINSSIDWGKWMRRSKHYQVSQSWCDKSWDVLQDPERKGRSGPFVLLYKMKFFMLRRQHDIVKQTLDSPRPGSHCNLIYSSAFGLTLDWFSNLSKPQFSLSTKQGRFVSYWGNVYEKYGIWVLWKY